MTTWTQLQADAAAWSNRTDLTAQISGFTALFEARAGRLLRTREQETSFSGTIADGLIALPSDWAAFKVLWLDGQEGWPMTPQSLESVVAQDSLSGYPRNYAIDGSNVRFDGSGDVLGVYYAKLPGIEANASNWLSLRAYDAYLFGVLAEVWSFLMDANKSAMYAARSQNALDSVMGADQRDRFSGPLVARKR